MSKVVSEYWTRYVLSNSSAREDALPMYLFEFSDGFVLEDEQDG